MEAKQKGKKAHRRSEIRKNLFEVEEIVCGRVFTRAVFSTREKAEKAVEKAKDESPKSRFSIGKIDFDPERIFLPNLMHLYHHP